MEQANLQNNNNNESQNSCAICFGNEVEAHALPCFQCKQKVVCISCFADLEAQQLASNKPVICPLCRYQPDQFLAECRDFLDPNHNDVIAKIVLNNPNRSNSTNQHGLLAYVKQKFTSYTNESATNNNNDSSLREHLHNGRRLLIKCATDLVASQTKVSKLETKITELKKEKKVAIQALKHIQNDPLYRALLYVKTPATTCYNVFNKGIKALERKYLQFNRAYFRHLDDIDIVTTSCFSALGSALTIYNIYSGYYTTSALSRADCYKLGAFCACIGLINGLTAICIYQNKQ